MIASGLHYDLSWELYKGIDRANISNLKEMARSALHYRYRCAHEKDSTTLALGRAAHAAILEPERFDREFVVWDERTDTGRLRPRNSKDFDAFAELHKGKVVLKPDAHRFALNVRDAVRSKPVALKYIREGRPEVTMLWQDVATSRWCKGRLDWLTSAHGSDALVGFKTARDLSPRAFSQQAAKLLYHLQWAYYFDGYSTLTGREPRMVEICVESEPPFDVVVYIIPADVIELGREEYRALLGRLDECDRARAWPGRADNEVVFELPAYLQKDDDEDVGDLELEGEARTRAVDALNEGP